MTFHSSLRHGRRVRKDLGGEHPAKVSGSDDQRTLLDATWVACRKSESLTGRRFGKPSGPAGSILQGMMLVGGLVQITGAGRL